MYQISDYINVSVALSEVLAEIGLNDVIVEKRRRTCLMMEEIDNVVNKIMDRKTRVYILGSQSEGTTTRGLNSDFDIVYCLDEMHVIQDWREWKHNVDNLLIVESEVTPPGYCMLQVLRPDAPLPVTKILDLRHSTDRQGKIFLKNTSFTHLKPEGQEQHGPAFFSRGQNGYIPEDNVYAYVCTSSLPAVQHWLSQQQSPWPSGNIKRYIANSLCFVVPVGSRTSPNEELEWRISTSLAERCLVLDLNITQLRVYVLMKMLLKTTINYKVPEDSHISSFMCKNVVLHCIQNTDHNAWQSHRLIKCLLFSLFTLYVCVVNVNCPHFIIRSSNLMAGRFTQYAIYQLQENLRWLFDNIISRGILSLYTDDVASRLFLKFSPLIPGSEGCVNDDECQVICAGLVNNYARQILTNLQMALTSLTRNRPSGPVILLQKYVQRLKHFGRNGNTVVRSACKILRAYFCTALGSFLASQSIQSSNIISHQALTFFYLGVNSDVASSKLKLASIFFCLGDMEKAEIVLRDLEGRYDINVCEPLCVCTQDFVTVWLRTRIEAFSLAGNVSDVTKLTSSCVIFTKEEKNCILQELHYEMYRSTQDDLQHRKTGDDWMDWAVVDSLPYLHFLCYKVYGRLQRGADQMRALCNLMTDIQIESNLGHRETALNLLGQCLEQENKWNYALQCYSWSLNIRQRNNAANFHVCRLLHMLRQ